MWADLFACCNAQTQTHTPADRLIVSTRRTQKHTLTIEPHTYNLIVNPPHTSLAGREKARASERGIEATHAADENNRLAASHFDFLSIYTLYFLCLV